MINYTVKPSEEVYEIEFAGKFIPGKFHPSWFHLKGLLGKDEAENATIQKAEEQEIIVFTTQFLRIIVQEEKFRIGTTQLLSIDLVKDMALGVGDLLRDSIDPQISFDLLLHFTFKNEDLLEGALNKLCNVENWKNYFPLPQAFGAKIIDQIQFEDRIQDRMLVIEPCGRKDMKHTLHVSLLNRFHPKSKKTSIVDLVKSDNQTFEDSVKLINKIAEEHFKNR